MEYSQSIIQYHSFLNEPSNMGYNNSALAPLRETKNETVPSVVKPLNVLAPLRELFEL